MSLALQTNSGAPVPEVAPIRTDSILLAEDDLIFRTILESWLRKWNFSTSVAENGLQAWAALQQEGAPNLIILDWMMPGMDGVEICRRIRARKSSRYPYILLLTARDAKQDLVNALDAGADDYLTKPFDANELKARLKVGARILTLQNDLQRKEEELRFEASHDRLTGLWNRGAILDFTERELARAQREGSLTGALMLDIDNFKKINDSYGHAVGDAVLQRVAQCLPQGVRSYDWVGRYGGEEFLLLITNCSPKIAEICAERVRAIVASELVQHQGVQVSVTVSIGAALSSPHSCSSEELLRIADEALYRAKSNGRNRVEVAWQTPVQTQTMLYAAETSVNTGSL